MKQIKLKPKHPRSKRIPVSLLALTLCVSLVVAVSMADAGVTHVEVGDELVPVFEALALLVAVIGGVLVWEVVR